MNEKIEKLKSEVIKASANIDFVHHEWFVDLHLNIVEKIALELCERYPSADRDLVLTLVWMHDYPKIIGGKMKEHDPIFTENTIMTLLHQTGFDENFTKKVLGYQMIFESKMTEDLSKAPIEVQIASSADGASHLFGPFFSIYWKENPNMTIPELMESNRNKLKKDWDRKIVLPEVKEALRGRHGIIFNQFAELPEKFLK